jgi:hypothetical protein
MTTSYLLNAVTADTVGDAVMGNGGAKVIQVSGVASSGGSVTLEGRMASDLDWVVLTYGGNPAVFTDDKILKLDFWAQTMELRASLSGSSGTFSVSVVLFG